MKILTAFALLALGGCATCERYPLACSIGAAVIVGSVAAMIAANDHHHGDHRGRICTPAQYASGIIGECVPPCQKINGACVP